MQIDFNIIGYVLVISIKGEIDHHSAQYISKKIDSEIISNNIKKIVFDFSNVSFMDSSGIGVIIGRYRNIQTLRGKAAIANVNPYIKKVFEMSGIPAVISLYDNLDSAINSI